MTLVDQPLQAPPLSFAGGVEAVIDLKGTSRVSVCVPARDEQATVEEVVRVVERLRRAGAVDEVLVVDDGSRDGTSTLARRAGATVVQNPNGPGKGQALRHAVEEASGDILVFLDADVVNITHAYVTRLVLPLLSDPRLQLVKASYSRPLDGAPLEGGRVTELLARPLLRRFFPELAAVAQPLAGECAVRRRVFDSAVLADGYGIEIGLLIDVFLVHGRAAIAEADLGERVHRNRPLAHLRPHADEVLAAVLARAGIDPERGLVSRG